MLYIHIKVLRSLFDCESPRFGESIFCVGFFPEKAILIGTSAGSCLCLSWFSWSSVFVTEPLSIFATHRFFFSGVRMIFSFEIQ